jgi:hypothetical protein
MINNLLLSPSEMGDEVANWVELTINANYDIRVYQTHTHSLFEEERWVVLETHALYGIL